MRLTSHSKNLLPVRRVQEAVADAILNLKYYKILVIYLNILLYMKKKHQIQLIWI